jgi:hypothetical protein
MENIIKKAVEGGWGNIGSASITRIDCDSADIDGKFYIHFWENVQSDMFSYNTFQVFCDPLFWQALGKACGWKGEKFFNGNLEDEWMENAIKFHKTNLTKGFQPAVEWLEQVIKE